MTAGAELIVVINASPWDDAKQAEREAVLVERARETGCAIVYLNLIGGQDEVVYDGASLLVNGDGSIAARAPAFRRCTAVGRVRPGDSHVAC